MKPFYQLDVKTIAAIFKTDIFRGLSKQDVRNKQKQDGSNLLPQKPQLSWAMIFVTQFASPLIYILLIAAVLIFFISDTPFDAFLIMGILLFNALIGTVQEGKTRKILKSLQQLITYECVVIRDDNKQLIQAKDLVTGDIVIVQAGEKIPADLRIIEAYDLHVDEAVLTGESFPVIKQEKTIMQELPLAEHTNMLYSGTYIFNGWAKAIVVAIGSDTQIGKINKAVQEIQTDIPLINQMHRISWFIIYSIVCICIFLFVLGFAAGLPLKTLIITLAALFVCVIPEGLPILVTLILITGVYRMARKKVLVKNMQAVEGLGHTQVIVIDKTGTITRNEMVVTKVFSHEKHYTVLGKGYYAQGAIFENGNQIDIHPDDTFYLLGQALYLLNTTTITFVKKRGSFAIKGDPTEAALFIFAKKIGINEEDVVQFKKIYEIAFASHRRYRAAFFEYNNQGVAFIAGSPEFIIEKTDDAALSLVLEEYTQEGLRVMAVAYHYFDLEAMPKEGRDNYFENIVNEKLKFLGICGLEDAIRQDVPHMINKAHKAGLTIIMATGDHRRTAIAIAKKATIYQDGDDAIDGSELNQITDEQLKQVILQTTVFSRVSPEQKIRIIKAIHAHGLTVTMTGDGVNDAPSLVASDIGIAMGSIGSEVAKEAADIILLDDSFINIINGIEEGRHVITTLRRVLLYFFSTNFAEVLLVLCAFIIGVFQKDTPFVIPLTAAQILFLNLVTDGFLDSALAMEKKEKNLLLDRNWIQKKQIYLLDLTIIAKIIFTAIPMALGTLFVFLLAYKTDVVLARTLTLATLSMYQWFNAWNCRSFNKSVFQLGFFSNKWLILASILVFCLQLMIIEVPFFQSIFGTTSLTLTQWVFVTLVSSTILFIEETRKLLTSESTI